MTTMRALVKYAAGPGHLELRDVPVPMIADGDVLVKISYCGICGSDLHIESGIHPARPPVIIGHEYSGIVAAVGKDVKELRVGDCVGYWRGSSPYLGVGSDGGFAEYMRAPAGTLWRIPDGITLQEATQFETLKIPIRIVRDGIRLEPGDRVVVTGPGPMGLWSANMAKVAGASHVTVLGGPGDEIERLPMALKIGADEAMLLGPDSLATLSGDKAPQCWIDASGAGPAISAAVETIASRGRICVCALGAGPWSVNMSRVAYRNIAITGVWGASDALIREVAEFMSSGKMKVAPLLSVMPLTKWQAAFAMLRRKDAHKILLDPSC